MEAVLLPRVNVTIFLEWLSKISDGRNIGGAATGTGTGTGAVGAGAERVALVHQIQIASLVRSNPVDSCRRNGLLAPLNKGNQFLDLNDIESNMLVCPIFLTTPSTCYSGFCEGSLESRDSSICQGNLLRAH